MSTDAEKFLSPRGLLINNKFCCDVLSFSKIDKVLESNQSLPYNDQGLQYMGFTTMGIQTLYTYLWPILEEFYEIQVQSNNARSSYRSVIDICNRAIELGSSARQDYDIIFDGLEELYNDPDNEDLYNKVHRAIRDRLDNTNIFSDIATAVREDITSSTQGLIDHQTKLLPLAKPLRDSSSVSDMLHDGDPSEEDVQDDMNAVQKLLETVDGQKMEDQSGLTLDDLEKLLGAAVAILSDITTLRDNFEDDARPGPHLVLNLRKENLIEQWDDLVKEVQEFKDQYQT
ncbi:hypothetical protein GGR58DRAFT_508370 [Xylaria digitata]|nr:hypothetical protein GGR58DRAFT_508370 [Xylaria digitata]